MIYNRLVSHFDHVLFRRLAQRFPARPVDLKRRDWRTILVFSAAGIGDTLTDSVAIRALKESFPDARVIVAAHRRRATLVRHNPFADEVVPYHKSFLRFAILALKLRRARPDLVVMLRGNDPDLWPLAWTVNRHAVVSCPVMTRFGFLISHPVAIPEWDRTHGVEQTLEIAQKLGASTADRRLVYQVREEEREALRRRFPEFGIGEAPRVVFQVGGGRRSAWRDWPAAYFAALGRRLLGHFGVQLVLLGGPDLREKAAAIAAALPRGVVNLVGKLSLTESATLLSLAKALVSTDTGIMHLGFAVGVDTVALIHCNNPASRVGPHGCGDKHRVVQLEPPPGVVPDTRVRMTRLTPGRVWPHLREICERNGVAPSPPPSR